MTDYSYINWASMSDLAIAEYIGGFVKNERILQDMTQDELSRAAGISRSTLSILESGGSVTVPTLLQVLRVLNQLHFLNAFVVQETISPLAQAKKEQYKRIRATGKNNKSKKDFNW
jgi:transcriptional regulator with XRE-family HTH domain